jgi:hypothetical protein
MSRKGNTALILEMSCYVWITDLCHGSYGPDMGMNMNMDMDMEMRI